MLDRPAPCPRFGTAHIAGFVGSLPRALMHFLQTVGRDGQCVTGRLTGGRVGRAVAVSHGTEESPDSAEQGGG